MCGVCVGLGRHGGSTGRRVWFRGADGWAHAVWAGRGGGDHDCPTVHQRALATVDQRYVGLLLRGGDQRGHPVWVRGGLGLQLSARRGGVALDDGCWSRAAGADPAVPALHAGVTALARVAGACGRSGAGAAGSLLGGRSCGRAADDAGRGTGRESQHRAGAALHPLPGARTAAAAASGLRKRLLPAGHRCGGESKTATRRVAVVAV
jgi:hypothetical protein